MVLPVGEGNLPVSKPVFFRKYPSIAGCICLIPPNIVSREITPIKKSLDIKRMIVESNREYQKRAMASYRLHVSWANNLSIPI
jgi:hypothetical protein